MIPFLILTSVAGLAVYLLGAFLWRTRIGFVSGGKPLLQASFEVFERKGKIKVLGKSRFRHILAGIFFTCTFYWGVPIYLWRYGRLRTAALILIPLAATAGLSYGLDVYNLVVKSLLLIPMRAVAGLWVTHWDQTYWRDTLIRRGWVSLGTCMASSRAEAVSRFKCRDRGLIRN